MNTRRFGKRSDAVSLAAGEASFMARDSDFGSWGAEGSLETYTDIRLEAGCLLAVETKDRLLCTQ